MGEGGEGGPGINCNRKENATIDRKSQKEFIKKKKKRISRMNFKVFYNSPNYLCILECIE